MTTTIQPPLTSAERVAARRYCGYAMYGSGQSGEQGYRFFHWYGFLEFRLTNASDDELVQIRAFLSSIANLESQIPTLMQQLAISEAAVLKTNPRAVRDSMNLYNTWRRELCNFLGIPPGEGLGSGTLRIIV